MRLTSPANVPSPAKPITIFEFPAGLAVAISRLKRPLEELTVLRRRPSVVPSLLDDMMYGMEGDE